MYICDCFDNKKKSWKGDQKRGKYLQRGRREKRTPQGYRSFGLRKGSIRKAQGTRETSKEWKLQKHRLKMSQ